MEEEKKLINGGDVLIKCLLQENVKYLYGVPGGQFMNMYDAIYRWGREKGINTVLFRHESAASHAADAWARVTNTPGICFGTVGPGAANLFPGVGPAWADNIPVIAIVPQVNTKYEGTFTLQGGVDHITMYKPFTKYQKSIREIEKIPDAVHKVFREATGGRPQPVLLEIYENAFAAEIEEDKIPINPKESYRTIAKPAIEKELIKKSLDLLLEAEKPLILSGGGISRAEAWNELQEFAEYLQIPVMTTVMGIGTISNKSRCLVASTVGGFGKNVSLYADVVLALGCKFSFTMGHGDEPFWKDSQKLIQVDIDPTIIGHEKPITLGVIGDCKIFLKEILEEVKKIKRIEKREWLDNLVNQRQNHINRYIKKASRDKMPILPERLVKDVYEFMDEDAILIIDGGDIGVHAVEQINFYKPRSPLSTVTAIGMGHIGASVPYAIGAKLAKPDKQVITISGDGSFIMNIQDLETVVRLGLNVIFVIGNNNAHGMIKYCQKLFAGKRYIDADFPEFNHAKLAEGFGCYGEVVTESNEIKPALERAKNSGKPAVIDIKIEQSSPEGTKLMGSMGIL
ncbi:MAG: thiamine pyrophosphate-binding protein [Candidatus Hodarchaeota archaeon]